LKTAGIIAEYNPFHNGHAYHIAKTRETGCTHIVAVMGGNFTQRGEAAVFFKQARCFAALHGGADLVIELPLPWAISSSGRFAFGGISLLDSLGCVDTLSFGSECGDPQLLREALHKVEALNGSAGLKEQLQKGYSFPRARQAAAQAAFPGESLPLAGPNDILAIDYLKALSELGSSISPLAVKRAFAAHDAGALGNFASASHIRGLILKGRARSWLKFVPKSAAQIYAAEIAAKKAPPSPEKISTAVLARLRTMGTEELARLPDVTEGLENRIFEAVKSAAGLDELYFAIKSKRYTMSRVRRVVLAAYLGMSKEAAPASPPYIRVLGASTRGLELLGAAKTAAKLPIVTRTAQINEIGGFAKTVFELECLASDLYALCLPRPLPCGLEQQYKIIVTK
jgi:predicted nucleotidyltransferase